jgi:hypothetical protein
LVYTIAPRNRLGIIHNVSMQSRYCLTSSWRDWVKNRCRGCVS